MSSCGIVTGRSVVSTKYCGNANQDVPYAYIFDSKSTDVISRPIYIDNCMVYKFQTFNLPEDTKIFFHRVLTGGGLVPTGEGCLCNDETVSKTTVIGNELFKIGCKPVTLDSCNGVLFLSIPGTYMLELSNPAALGQVIVMAEQVDGYIPPSLIIGNPKPEHYVGVDESTPAPTLPSAAD